MARRRQYGEDLTYAEWHRDYLPLLYGRVGHRQDMADRDWTEFCHHCKQPLAIIEEVVDRGQDLNDKATTVTRHLARLSGVFGALLAPKMDRPDEVQREIEALNRRVRELEAQNPIVSFKVKQIYPQRTRLALLTPDDWALELLLLHRNHHRNCTYAHRRGEDPVHIEKLLAAKRASRIWTPANDQLVFASPTPSAPSPFSP